MTKLSDNLAHNRQSEDSNLFTGPHTVESNDWIDTAPFGRLLHLEIIEANNGTAVLTMPFLFDFAQGSGFMHGGALVSLADTATVMAIKSLVPEGTHFATISLKTNFLYPVKSGIITAKARVTAHRKNHLYGRVTIFNQEDRPVLEFKAAFKMGKNREINAGSRPTVKNPAERSRLKPHRRRS